MWFATYPGDVEHIVGETKGPDLERRYWRATAAVHDPVTARTRVQFRPVVVPAEFDALADAVPSQQLHDALDRLAVGAR